MATRDELGFYSWNGTEHIDVSGIECYALTSNGKELVGLDIILAIWPKEMAIVRVNQMPTETGVIANVEINLLEWPSNNEWHRMLYETLSALVESGAELAWAGGYDCGPSPEVLKPKNHAGNVVAAFSAKSGFLCNADVNGPLTYLSDDQLATLDTHA